MELSSASNGINKIENYMTYNLLLIGSGAWGQNYIKTLKIFSGVKLEVADRTNWRQLIDKKPDGVIVATPPESHIEIAQHALIQDIPTMIEKPLALSSQDAKKLLSFEAPILVNHIHLFSEAYQKIKQFVSPDKITSIQTTGYGPSLPRTYSALWDYGSHDISMILDLVQSVPETVFVNRVIKCGQEAKGPEMFDLDLVFDTCNTQSTFGSSKLFSVRDLTCRSITVHFEGMTLAYDDTARPSHHVPPLTNALCVFLNAISGISDSRLGLDLALKVTETLDRCEECLAAQTT